MEKAPYYIPASLLSTNNIKTMKGEKLGWKTYILYMSPHNQNSQSKSICPMASKGCSSACLYGSGKGGIDTVRKGRTNKTEFFLSNRELFIKTIYSEIAQIAVKHSIEGGDFVIRLNGTSDISWEKFKIKDGKNIFELFPNVQFYDYTKNHTRFKSVLPKNYYLMFSRSETNDAIAMELLKKKVNVAMVFDKVPTSYMGYKVIDGDENDLRHLDKKGVIVGLRYKKIITKGFDNDAAFKNGFAIRVKESTAVKSKLKKAA
jgi:hypothetical protein